METTQIELRRDPPLARLTLANPAKANALSRTMVDELTTALTAIAADDRIRVVILDAAGKHFCAGHDLSEMVDREASVYRDIFEECNRMMQLVHRLPQPVIAQVQGVATAAGCQLVAWCDLAVAEEDARFATPGVKIGLFCTTPMVALTRAMGRKAALEMLLTGRFFSAGEACRRGLINRVVPFAELAPATETLAHQIAGASGYVLALGKQAFYDQVAMDDDTALAYAARTMVVNNLSRDAREGIDAYLAKRAPQWRNR